MNPQAKKVFGEDKLSKLIRLMQRYETQINLVEDKVSIHLDSDGSGYIKVGFSCILEFEDTNELVEFLEGNELKRTLMAGQMSLKKFARGD